MVAHNPVLDMADSHCNYRRWNLPDGLAIRGKVSAFERWLIRQWISRHKEEKMIQVILGVLAWLVKNTALIIGILEAVTKVVAGIVSATPTKRDDWLVAKVDVVFSAVKKALYTIADIMAGKKPIKL